MQYDAMATLNVHPVKLSTASGLAQRVASKKELKIAELALPGGAPWCDFGRRSKVPNLSRFEPYQEADFARRFVDVFWCTNKPHRH